MKSVSFLTVFFAGIFTFFSPCVFPLIPGYISYITGVSFQTLTEKKNTSFRFIFVRILLFVLGFTFIFTLMGATASVIGGFFQTHRRILMITAGITIILFGLHLMGLLKIGFLEREKRARVRKGNGLIWPFVMGMAFAVGWTPCVGPILGSVLLIASVTDSIYSGMLLLATYSLGFGLPFLIVGLSINQFLKFFTGIKGALPYIKIASGGILILFGVLLILNKLSLLVLSV
ncbi:MAG TPA: cytochrome c biogenesis protein CcdA [Actinobacteria bacterium]|nr:cytochrome c biogenesis protein CcdA [Actinomycetota bacterium]